MKKLFLFTLCMFAALTLKADISPEPQISYIFKYSNDEALKIVPQGSEQFQCADTLCSNPEPLGIYGLQKLYCGETECHSISYEFKPFQKLVVEFSDGKTRESQIFNAPSKTRSAMQVNVKEDRLEVIPLAHITPSEKIPAKYIIATFISILILEILAAILFLWAGELPYSILGYVLAANIISIPLNWWVLSNYINNNAVLWTIASFFELLFIYFLNKKKINFKKTAALVLFANVTSFSVSMIVAYALMSF